MSLLTNPIFWGGCTFGAFVTVLICGLIEWLAQKEGEDVDPYATCHSINPPLGTWVDEDGNTVNVHEIAEHWVKYRRANGEGFTRSRHGFMKNYIPASKPKPPPAPPKA
jgi:hypothetical protein